MTYPTISNLPPAPQRTQSPEDFSTTADTFVAALPDLVTEVNAAGDYIDTKTISVGNDFQGAYSAGTTYTTGQSVLYADLFYLSLVDSNTGNTPDSSPSQWVQIVGSAAGGGGGTVDFTASGSLSNGDLVKLNSDGTVSVIQGGTGVGPQVVFEAASTLVYSSVFDSNSNKVVISYADSGNSSYGTAVVGTVNVDGTISFGTPVVFISSNAADQSMVFDSLNNKVVIAFKDFGDAIRGKAVVGTVSGTSISFGSVVAITSGRVDWTSAAFDSNSNKVVISYSDDVNTDYATAVVGTVSGTSISFGSSTVFHTTNPSYIKSTFDSNLNKVVVCYRDENDSGYGKAVVGTVSGTSISFGSPATFAAADLYTPEVVFDSNSNKVVITYRDYTGTLGYGKAVVGTVSGTSISFGSPVTFAGFDVVTRGLCFDTATNKVIATIRDQSSGNFGKVTTGTVSGTSITFSTPITFASEQVNYIVSTFDSNVNKALISFQATDDASHGTASSFEPSDAGEWIGISSSAAADGAPVTINVISSVNEGQSGLTTGAKYYLTDGGTLSKTFQDGREVGRAIAADKILITQGSIS